MRLRRRMARARHTNWRWPTEKLEPPSATCESRPALRSETASFSFTCGPIQQRPTILVEPTRPWWRAHRFQSFPQQVVVVLAERVEVSAQAARKQDRILRDDGDLGAQVVQAQALGVDAIDEDVPLGLRQPEQRRDQRRLAGARPTHDSDLSP